MIEVYISKCKSRVIFKSGLICYTYQIINKKFNSKPYMAMPISLTDMTTCHDNVYFDYEKIIVKNFEYIYKYL